MVPKTIQFWESDAETLAFRQLRDEVSNEFTALHHVPWKSPDKKRRTVEGEADFVLVHPELGALVLEVKGGTLRYEAATGRWYQKSKGKDDEHRIPDPFDQAANGARAIVEFMKTHRVSRKNWGPIGFGVCFPEGVFQSEPTPAIRPEVMIDGRHLRESGGLEARIREVMAWYPRDQFVQGADGAGKLIAALNHDVVVDQPLGLRTAGVDRAITELSAQQYRILRLLKHKRRLAVSGPAGSGKTLLALERARDAAQSGDETLLLTFNRPLADHLVHEARGLSHLEVCTFHQLCHRLAERAGVSIPVDQREFFDQAPTIALEALDALGGLYEAIVVDEGQVMEEDWWFPIEEALRDRNDGLLWVFYDDNQALYRRPRGLPSGMEIQPLTETWRSSRQIHEVVMRYYDGGEVECLGPDGPDVEIVPANGQPRKQVSRVLHRLVTEQHARASDIVVLTPRGFSQSEVSGDVGSFRLVESPAGVNDVRLSSIKRFLGLESQIVVMCELPEPTHPEFRSHMYVGFSRARAHLVIVGDIDYEQVT
ncbi:MAG: ATP-dependent helicase [Actinomycetota bacterium]|nr:ATP-dependent helicase [Actinomycetota bacterium]